MAAKLRFLGCNKTLAEACGVFLGICRDDPKGREQAPDIVRACSRKTDDYHIITGKSLSAIGLHDLGNISLAEKEDPNGFCVLQEKAEEAFKEKKLLMSVSEVPQASYYLIKSAHDCYENLRVVTVGAHHGREEGEEITPETYLSHCCKDFLAGENLLQLGIRCGSKASYEKGLRRHRHLPPRVRRGVIERLPRLYHVPVYVVIDLDVLEPCFAPGVNQPIPGGIGVTELIETIRYFESVSVIGAEITGLNLENDQSNITATLVSALVKEAYIYFLANNQFIS